MQNGVLIIALGYPLYGSCAFNLAMSLKAYDSAIKIAVLHDETSMEHLTEKERAIFDKHIIIAPEIYTINGTRQYQYLKLCADIYSPFENTTVIDADTIWFPDKKFSWFLGEMIHREFWIGYNDEYNLQRRSAKSMNYTFWALNNDVNKVVEFHGLKNNLPQTVSGLFFFKKGAFSKEVFERARAIYNSPSPNVPWANGKPDEYCFNVALSQMGYTQEPGHVVYFDKVCGKQSYESIYGNYWCMANGGAKCEQFIIQLYNKLVKKYAVRLGYENLYYHQDKQESIPERKIF